MLNPILANAMSLYGARNDRLTEKYLSLGQLYDSRKWHQLTNELDSIVNDESLWIDRNILDLYKDFVEKFESKLNPLRLVLFAEAASKQHFTGDGFEPASEGELQAALEFMESISKKAFLSDEAKAVAKMRICDYLISLNRTAEAKKLLEEVFAKFSMLEGSGSESTVKSSYYRAESNYYRLVGPAGAFYDSVMQYLAHTPFSKMPAQKRMSLALDVVTAALVADNVFNFGDVLRYEVVQELGKSPTHMWLLELLVIFNDGDVREFNVKVDKNRAAIENSPTLKANMEVLKQKIALLSLVRVVFDRPPEARDISFADIAQASLLPIDQVEWLVMRAFSKKLLRGKIDEIEQIVHVSWLMPRVLDAVQTKVLDEKLLAWSQNVKHALLLEQQVPELFASQ